MRAAIAGLLNIPGPEMPYLPTGTKGGLELVPATAAPVVAPV